MAISKAELKKLISLKSKKGRCKENSFLVGGIRLMEEALKSAVLPVKVYCAMEVLTDRGRKLITELKSKKIRVLAVAKREIEAISDTDSPQGVAGLFKIPKTDLSKLYKLSSRKLLLCDQINDPGNLGTLMRSALAFGFDMMLVTDNTVELYNPKVVRSSAGAIFQLPIATITYNELNQFKELRNVKIAAAVSPQSGINDSFEMASANHDGDDLLMLAIGSEAEGLSNEVLEMSDCKISIKHEAKVESLNAAVAGSILMYQIFQETRKQQTA